MSDIKYSALWKVMVQYEEALKQLQWRLKTAKAFDHEEVIMDSILIVDKALGDTK